MGSHITKDGKFLSDRYIVTKFGGGLFDVSEDKLVLSFHDRVARTAIYQYAKGTPDKDLARDIKARIRSIMIEEDR